MTLSKIEHLTKEDIIKNGSIFTPKYLVDIARNWLENKINRTDYIIDFGVGYGAFISEFLDLSNNLIATDLDEDSINLVKKLFPSVDSKVENSLLNISRKKYGIKNNDNIIVIGNPPYNDITSQYKKGEKGNLEIDETVSSRDLGISFMKMYAILQPNYICILHPLSYLIKQTNFNSLKYFKDHYILEKGLIFSSKEFESIKKTNAEFPVVLALYKKTSHKKMTYNYIENFTFEILNSDHYFVLSNYNTIDGKIPKYPKKGDSKDNGLKFYTMRDINALRRNKSFLISNSNNGIKITLDELYKYAWVDFFKNNFNSDEMFLYGNLSPLYSEKIETPTVKKELISYILQTNDVVKNYVIDNNLMDEIIQHYKVEKLLTEFPKLNKIIDSLTK